MRKRNWRGSTLLALGAFLCGGCSGEGPVTVPAAGGEEDHEDHDDHARITNRVPVDAARRRALGLTFATVEERPIGRAWTLPGEFELAPDAVRAYHAPVSGRVELLVDEFERVEPGEPLYTVDSPDWRAMQHDLSEALGAIQRTSSELAGARASREEARTKVGTLRSRLDALEELEVRRADLEAELATALVAQARYDTEVTSAESAHLLALEHYEGTLKRAASLVGLTVEELDEVEGAEGATPTHRWWSIQSVVVRARAAGVVDELHATAGAWVQPGDPVVHTVRAERLRFRARVTTDDLPAVLEGLSARIVRTQDGGAPVPVGRALLAPRADDRTRRERVVALDFDAAAWMRAGASAWLELVDDAARAVPAVPLDCVQRDGLAEVIFRRDPKDPDVVVRLEADLGAADERWVEVRSGVRVGDQVVLDGAWELALESSLSGVDTSGGHFHADGTFHAEGDDH